MCLSTFVLHLRNPPGSILRALNGSCGKAMAGGNRTAGRGASVHDQNHGRLFAIRGNELDFIFQSFPDQVDCPHTIELGSASAAVFQAHLQWI
jgi:hypothetical protein